MPNWVEQELCVYGPRADLDSSCGRADHCTVGRAGWQEHQNFL
jgi:hypothetical protein